LTIRILFANGAQPLFVDLSSPSCTARALELIQGEGGPLDSCEAPIVHGACSGALESAERKVGDWIEDRGLVRAICEGIVPKTDGAVIERGAAVQSTMIGERHIERADGARLEFAPYTEEAALWTIVGLLQRCCGPLKASVEPML